MSGVLLMCLSMYTNEYVCCTPQIYKIYTLDTLMLIQTPPHGSDINNLAKAIAAYLYICMYVCLYVNCTYMRSHSHIVILARIHSHIVYHITASCHMYTECVYIVYHTNRDVH